VTEALWKGRPMIAGNVGGIPLQIEDSVSGFLVSSSEEAEQRSIEVLGDPELAKELGRAGKTRARERFLTPRLLRDWLRIFGRLEG
jgi:trehalose synthase